MEKQSEESIIDLCQLSDSTDSVDQETPHIKKEAGIKRSGKVANNHHKARRVARSTTRGQGATPRFVSCARLRTKRKSRKSKGNKWEKSISVAKKRSPNPKYQPVPKMKKHKGGWTTTTVHRYCIDLCSSSSDESRKQTNGTKRARNRKEEQGAARRAAKKTTTYRKNKRNVAREHTSDDRKPSHLPVRPTTNSKFSFRNSSSSSSNHRKSFKLTACRKTYASNAPLMPNIGVTDTDQQIKQQIKNDEEYAQYLQDKFSANESSSEGDTSSDESSVCTEARRREKYETGGFIKEGEGSEDCSHYDDDEQFLDEEEDSSDDYDDDEDYDEDYDPQEEENEGEEEDEEEEDEEQEQDHNDDEDNREEKDEQEEEDEGEEDDEQEDKHKEQGENNACIETAQAVTNLQDTAGVEASVMDQCKRIANDAHLQRRTGREEDKEEEDVEDKEDHQDYDDGKNKTSKESNKDKNGQKTGETKFSKEKNRQLSLKDCMDRYVTN